MTHTILLRLALLVATQLAAEPAETKSSAPAPHSTGTTAALPFHREVINRYSLNGRPRSLSVRQGDDVWLGYDLEQAKPFKVWQAPAGKPGVLTTVFVSRSSGSSWFDDASKDTWQLLRAGKTIPVAVRYLGCSQRADHFELSWELKHDTGVLKLRERIQRAPASASDRVVREMRVEALAPGETLLLPTSARNAWAIAHEGETRGAALAGDAWHRVTLAPRP